MKVCNYCGKTNEDSALSCTECGTSISDLIGACAQKKLPRILDARIATIILLVYLVTQVICETVMAVIAITISGEYGIHNVQQTYAIYNSLEPIAMLLTFLFGAAVIILTSFKLIPMSIKDHSPNGAGWVLGCWKAIIVALLVGLIIGICAHFLNILRPHLKYSELGPVTRISLLPGGLPMAFVVVAVILAPLVEEMLFRGVLYGGYRKSFGPLLAAILTTVLFVMWHIPEYVHFPPGLVAVIAEALAALWCRLRWSAIGPAVAVHAGFNSVSALLIEYKAWH